MKNKAGICQILQAHIFPAKCPAPFTGNATSIHPTKIFRKLFLLWELLEVTGPEDFFFLGAFPELQYLILTAIIITGKSLFESGFVPSLYMLNANGN